MLYSTPALRELDYHVKKSPGPIQECSNYARLSDVDLIALEMKIEGTA
jgi:hypothetical protein